MKRSKLIFERSELSLALQPGFSPMKGVSLENFSRLEYPVLASPKFDGIRCITREPIIKDLFGDKKLDILTYALKPVPNGYVRKVLTEYNLANLDGELILHGEDGKMIPYNPVQSAIMTSAGEPKNFVFYVFDIIDYAPYWERQECLLMQAKKEEQEQKYPHVRFVKPVTIPNADSLAAYEEACITSGYEGVIVRSLDGPYKAGRSTMKEGYMYKIKRFKDAEATVIGFEEEMENRNEQTINERGLAERSSHKANLVPRGVLGALRCSGHNGVVFNIGTGFTDADRAEIWKNQDQYLNQLVKYKYQPHGMKDAPRSPVFLGWRSKLDL